MREHFPVLIPLIPLTASLLGVAFSKIHKALGEVLVTLSLFASFVIAVLLMQRVMAEGEIRYYMGNWEPPLGIEFVVDPVNGVVVLVIAAVAAFTAVYSRDFVKELNWLRRGGYYSLMGLLSVGLFGMTLTGDVFNLYVFLEISSLSCYGLIAIGSNRGVFSAFRYLLVGTIGASVYLLGIGILYGLTGTLNMKDLSALLPAISDNPIIGIAFVCLFGAFAIKMALFPFHGWQPDAYTYSHPAAAPLITGAMSKVPAYAMIRFFFFVFQAETVFSKSITTIVGVCGALAMLYGSYIAIKQIDLRRMFAYSSIAQLGYIALGIGIGNAYGLSGALLHVINHAFMKGGLFLAIGAVIFKYGIKDLNHIGGLHKKMPWTAFTIVMASLSMVGIPPTGGFFSKYYLMIGAYEGGMYIYIAVLVISTILNAVYFLRVLERMFIDKDSEFIQKSEFKGTGELPLDMLLPIILFGVAIVAVGIFSGAIVGDVIIGYLKGVGL